MNIISIKPLTLAEVSTYLAGEEGKEKAAGVRDYIKKFGNLSAEKSKEICEELKKLDNVKIKEEYAVKVADMLPIDAESVHKIFHDVSLDENEVNAIIDITKKY